MEVDMPKIKRNKYPQDIEAAIETAAPFSKIIFNNINPGSIKVKPLYKTYNKQDDNNSAAGTMDTRT